MPITQSVLDKVGFHSGDIAAVRRQPEARNSDIAVVRTGQEVTLKCYRRLRRARVVPQLVSPNHEHRTIALGPTRVDIEIVGIVVDAIVGGRGTAK